MRGDEYQAYSSYNELMVVLVRFCREGRSGTMYIATPTNQFARIVLDRGTIVALSFRSQHGTDALPSIRGIPGGRFKFSAGQTHIDAKHALPADYNPLQMLCAGTASRAAPRGALPADGLAPALRMIERQLAEFLGPIAGIVCEEQLGKLGPPRKTEDLCGLLDALASEIRDPAKARRFHDQVWAKLAN